MPNTRHDVPAGLRTAAPVPQHAFACGCIAWMTGAGYTVSWCPQHERAHGALKAAPRTETAQR